MRTSRVLTASAPGARAASEWAAAALNAPRPTTGRAEPAMCIRDSRFRGGARRGLDIRRHGPCPLTCACRRGPHRSPS